MGLSDWLSLVAIVVSIITFAFVLFEAKRKPSLDIYALTNDNETVYGFETFVEAVLSNNSSNTVSISHVLMYADNKWVAISSMIPEFISLDHEGIRRYSDALPINIPARESKAVVLQLAHYKPPEFLLDNKVIVNFKVFSSNGNKNHKIKNFNLLQHAHCVDVADRRALRK